MCPHSPPAERPDDRRGGTALSQAIAGCLHSDARLEIRFESEISFVYCMECDLGAWWSDERGRIERPDRDLREGLA